MAHGKIIGNLDDFTRAVGKVHKGSSNSSKKVNSLIGGGDTGSFLLDYIKHKSDKKKGIISKGMNNAQRKIADLDMRAGAKMHSTLSKGLEGKEKLGLIDKARKKASNSFIKEYSMDLSKADGLSPGMQAKINAGSLTEPIAKAKDKVVPFVGSMTILNALASKDNKEGGEDKVASNNAELIEKIAGCKPSKTASVHSVDEINHSELLAKAQGMLKQAASEINTLQMYCEKLAIENQNLHLDLVQRGKHDEAIKVANEMHEKGLIKKADIEEKALEISSMDEESFGLFKKAMEDVVVPQAQGVSDLTFVLGEDNIKSRETLKDAFRY